MYLIKYSKHVTWSYVNNLFVFSVRLFVFFFSLSLSNTYGFERSLLQRSHNLMQQLTHTHSRTHFPDKSDSFAFSCVFKWHNGHFTLLTFTYYFADSTNFNIESMISYHVSCLLYYTFCRGIEKKKDELAKVVVSVRVWETWLTQVCWNAL